MHGSCYARTRFELEEPEELGRTQFLNINLLAAEDKTEIVCGRGYPFVGPAPPLSAADTPVVTPEDLPPLVQYVDDPTPLAVNDTNTI